MFRLESHVSIPGGSSDSIERFNARGKRERGREREREREREIWRWRRITVWNIEGVKMLSSGRKGLRVLRDRSHNYKNDRVVRGKMRFGSRNCPHRSNPSQFRAEENSGSAASLIGNIDLKGPEFNHQCIGPSARPVLERFDHICLHILREHR